MKKYNLFLVLGAIGILITGSMNVLMMTLMGFDARDFVSLWMPLYLVWVVFIVIGLVRAKRSAMSSTGK